MFRKPRLLLSNDDDLVPSPEEIPSGRLPIKRVIYQRPVIQQVVEARNKNKKTRRKIRFHEIIKVRTTLHVDDMTDDEYFNTWYSDEEMLAMKTNMTGDLKRFLEIKQVEKKITQRKKKQLIMDMIPTGAKNGKSEKTSRLNNENHYKSDDFFNLVSDNVTIRGLEHRTKEGSEVRHRTKFLTLYAVLKEQEMQKVFCNSYDDEAIREAYQQSGAKLSAMKAHKVGVRDARDAKLISLLEKDNSRRNSIINPFKVRINSKGK